MRTQIIFSLLMFIKAFGSAFYNYQVRWIGDSPKDPWANLRLVMLLNHTSLYEPLFAGFVPIRFIHRVARQGLVPVADKTFCRPMVGRFFGMIAQNVVPISRLRDETWTRFLDIAHPRSLIIIAPEGRMKRANGMDKDGNPMTVRGGVADILQSLTGGRMLIAYSGGLHHVQVPSQTMPRLFKTLRMQIENLDIGQYRKLILNRFGPDQFKYGVIEDLQQRRDAYCT